MPERVEVRISEKAFAHWSSLEINLGLDTIDTIALSAPFEAERREFRELFRPFGFQPIDVTLDGVALFTGTLVEVTPNVTEESSTVDVAGYAIPGVLGDCSPPASALPLEWHGVGLREICELLCAHFGVDVDFGLRDNAPFGKVALDPLSEKRANEWDKKAIHEQTLPWAFLTKLAQQRNALLTSSTRGKLKVWRAETSGTPVAQLEGGLPPLVKVTPSFSPQDYYSEITGFAPAKRGRKGTKWTENNPRLGSSVRPHCFSCDDSEDADAPMATAAKLSRMFGNSISYMIEGLPTWRTPQGDIWRPNTFIRLKAPNAMVYDWTDLLIRNVRLSQTEEMETADLNVCLPGSFGGEVPKRFPWEL